MGQEAMATRIEGKISLMDNVPTNIKAVILVALVMEKTLDIQILNQSSTITTDNTKTTAHTNTNQQIDRFLGLLFRIDLLKCQHSQLFRSKKIKLV